MAEPARLAFPAPGTAGERVRTCSRCESLAELAVKRGLPRPHIAPARSWVSCGIRYWGGLCYRCEDYEKAERQALHDQQKLKGLR